MDDFGLLTKDFGLRPQGKSSPMAATSAVPSSRPTWGSSDVFGGAAALHPKPSSPPSFNSPFCGMDNSTTSKPSKSSSSSNLPAYDKAIYDEDIFGGLPGVKSSHADVFGDVFASAGPPPQRVSSPPIDELLERLSGVGRGKSDIRGGSSRSAFDELIPGFGGSSQPQKRETVETNNKQVPGPSAWPSMNAIDDPFVILERTSATSSGLFNDPLEHINMPMNSGSMNANGFSVNEYANSVLVSTNMDKVDQKKERCSEPNASPGRSSVGRGPFEESSFDSFEHMKPKTQTVDEHLHSSHFLFEKSSRPSYSSPAFDKGNVQNSGLNMNNSERDDPSEMSLKSDEAGDVWLTVDEIPLFTQTTYAPPPLRPPPPIGGRKTSTKADRGASVQNSGSIKASGALDELESFAMGKQSTYSDEDFETNSAAAASAAAMKEAMDRAEAKFRQAKEVRERERDAKSFKSRDFTRKEADERVMEDVEDQEDREMQEQLEREKLQKEKEEKEREEKRHERARELEHERVRARQAVDRATREARERAAAEALIKAERAAIEKANAEARVRAERAAVQKAAAEARERAGADARQRQAAATERAQQEVRLRAERAAVERAAAEARERAAAEARERAAATAREKQNKNENDLESFFGMGTRANSAPRQRAAASENIFDTQSQNKAGSDGVHRSSVGSSTFRKASSTTNIVDDLSSIFGAAPSSGEFQEVEGESEERRKARFERHQRTLERAAKALAEKNERDMQAQRDQAERHMLSESLDIEIKRWAAGKDGNLRALLSTLQYVLWPECGWQPVSLTDLITSVSVKKVYRKATLCVHPDKVQQKGANLQQKYIAEKVFDLLKEAWNKFNSEELF